MFRQGTPVDPRLAQQDLTPLIQANALEQQAIVNLSNQINKTVEGLQQKKMQKEAQEQRMMALAPILEQSELAGVPGTDTYNAALKELAKSDDFLNTVTNLETARLNSMVKLSELEATTAEDFQPLRIPEDQFRKNYPNYEGTVKRVTDAQGNVFVEISTQDITPTGGVQSFGGIKISNSRQVVDTSEPGKPKIITVGVAQEGGTDSKGNAFYMGAEYGVLPDGTVVPFNPDTMLNYNTSDVNANRNRLLKVQEAASTAARELKGLEDYLDARGRLAKDGASRLANQIVGKMKTFFGGELNDEQLQEFIAAGKFRQQLGNLRVAILGPGVMTEFDRIVLEEAIGGFGVTSNIEAVAELIKPVLEQKIAQVEQASNTFNDVLSISPRLSKEFKSFNIENLVDASNLRGGPAPSAGSDDPYAGMSIVEED